MLAVGGFVASLASGSPTGGQGQARPLSAPTTIAGASAGLVTVTQENVSKAIPPESGVAVGFEGGQYLIATSSNFQLWPGNYRYLPLRVRIGVAGTTQSAEATSMYACMDGPWRLLAVPAAELRLAVLKLGVATAGPAWVAMAGSKPAPVRITGPVDPGQFSLWDWGADPDHGDILQFDPPVAHASDGPPAFSPTEFGGAALLQKVPGGVRVVGLASGLLGNAGNTRFDGVATGLEDIRYLLKHPGGC
jgi:hypothetical protein